MNSIYSAYLFSELPLDKFSNRPVHLSLYECSVADIAKIANKVSNLFLEDNVWEDWTGHVKTFVPNYLLPETEWIGKNPNAGCPFANFQLVEGVGELDEYASIFFTPIDTVTVNGPHFNVVCLKGSPADVLVRVMLDFKWKPDELVNLLEDHPDGLGKHVKLYRVRGHVIQQLDKMIVDSITAEEIPFLVTWGDEQYLAILGTDLTNGTVPMPSLEYFRSRINEDLKFYVDQIWEYMQWTPETLTIHLVGYKGE